MMKNLFKAKSETISFQASCIPQTWPVVRLGGLRPFYPTQLKRSRAFAFQKKKNRPRKINRYLVFNAAIGYSQCVKRTKQRMLKRPQWGLIKATF